MVHTAWTTRRGFVVEMARARFDFDRQNSNDIAKARGASPRQTLDRLRAAATRTTTPPVPLDTRIVEEVVHGEDLRRPLGLTRAYPIEAVLRSLRYQARTSQKLGGAKELLSRLRLVATDTDYTAGEGSEVHGPVLALLLAISGRRVALDELDGAGVATITTST